jgi:Zn-dependent M28 family amino/carboxypeptidase
VLLDLLLAFKSRPLRRFSVRAVFFDHEEGGLAGSQAYIAGIRNKPLPAAAINFDIFGYGDTLFLTSSSLAGPLVQALQHAAEGSSIAVRMTDLRQYPASDHRSMTSAGIETLGVALIDGSEIEMVLQRSARQRRILTIIHKPQDTMENIRPKDMEEAVPSSKEQSD